MGVENHKKLALEIGKTVDKWVANNPGSTVLDIVMALRDVCRCWVELLRSAQKTGAPDGR